MALISENARKSHKIYFSTQRDS